MDPSEVGADVKPGMAGEASGRVERGEELRAAGIEVPATAIFSPDGSETQESFVWVIDDDASARLRQVTPLRITERGGTIVQGLTSGERIATAGVHGLREGQQVRIP